MWRSMNVGEPRAPAFNIVGKNKWVQRYVGKIGRRHADRRIYIYIYIYITQESKQENIIMDVSKITDLLTNEYYNIYYIETN